MESLQSRRLLAVLLSYVSPSVCPFWFSGGLAELELAGWIAF